jgi:endonuclease/exonuclease/phosphatase family metal-dependent hydrolase
MPFYNDLRPTSDYKDRDFALVFPAVSTETEWKIRTIKSLLRLKTGLDEKIPSRKTETNLLVASWNIKEFGHTTQRLPEAYYYIAEIIARFDLIAIQEVKSTLKDLEIVMRILGSDWDYLVNDITDGVDGNSEQSAYIYNTERVRLSGLAGEISLWDELTKNSPVKQLKRAPYVTGFRAGWKRFAMVSLHLHPGQETDDLAHRGEEIRLLLEALAAKKGEFWTENLVLCGDFNLYKTKDDPAVLEITDSGFSEVDGLVGKDTNASQTQAYDRLFFKESPYFKVMTDDQGQGVGDVFNPFEFVFLPNEHVSYKQAMLDVYGGEKDLENDAVALEDYFMTYWRRNQISDHYPIWFELAIDSSVSFLASRKKKLEGAP